ncbi:MAG: leucine-rich repeat protein [Muribaculaceae bacterium]|nr:leucine-rich repeat protein [Muribaculaceae bacterium]
MTKITFCGFLTAFIALVAPSANAIEINVTEPGTFKDLIIDSEGDLSTLVVKGTLNADDVAYLTGASGKIREVKNLDLSDMKLEISETTPYRHVTISSEAGGGEFAYCYYSETPRVESKTTTGGLGLPILTWYIYGPEMTGLLANTNFKKVTLPVSLTSVPDYMFLEASLEEVACPPRATSVGRMAFKECPLRSIELPKSVKTIGENSFFRTQLTTLELPESLESIGLFAFSQTPLTSVRLPESCATLEAGSFHYCQSLSAINLENVKEIGDEAFSYDKSLKILDLLNVEKIGDEAFYNCILNEVNFSGKLRWIGNMAFWKYRDTGSNWKILNHPEGIESIGNSAFSGCDFTKVSLPSSIEYIGEDAFNWTPWSNSLASTAIGGVVYLGDIAYMSVNRPETVIFREGTKSVSPNFSFANTKEFTLPNSCKSIYGKDFSLIEKADLGKGLKIIGKKCLCDAKKLTGVDIPETVEIIEAGAFAWCGLTSITLPAGLKRIEGDPECPGAFEWTNDLTSLTLPEGLEYLGNGSFYGESLATLRYNCRNMEVEGYTFTPSNGVTHPNVFGRALEKIVIGKEVERIPDGLFSTTASRLEFEESNVPLEIGDFGLNGGGETLVKGSIDRVTKIGQEGLSYLKFPEGTVLEFPNLKSLGESALYFLSGIRSITLGIGVEHIGLSAISRTDGIEVLKYDIPSLKFEEVAPFFNGICDGEIDTIIIGKNVMDVPNRVFEDAQLKKLIFEPRETTRAASLRIGNRVFGYNAAFSSVEFPSDLTYIGDSAFGTCQNLSSVFIHSKAVPEIAENAFRKEATVYVPASDEKAYKAALPDNKVEPYSIESFAFNKKRLTLLEGDSEILLLSIRPAECREMEIKFVSSDPEVADIDETGKVTALSIGQTVISAYFIFDPDFRTECTVDVTDLSSIGQLGDEQDTQITQYYDTEGRKVIEPSSPGVYVGRRTDGTSSKIIIR